MLGCFSFPIFNPINFTKHTFQFNIHLSNRISNSFEIMINYGRQLTFCFGLLLVQGGLS